MKNSKKSVTLLLVCVATVIAIATIISCNRSDSSITTTATSNSTAVTTISTGKTTDKESTTVPSTSETLKTDNSTLAPITSQPPVTEAPVTTETPTYDFVLDLSEYEKYMNPTGDDWSDDYLILVNVDNPISNGEELTIPALNNIISSTTITDYNHSHENFKLNEYALKAITAMFMEAAAEGITDLQVQSDYRTYSRQNSIFNSNVSKTFRWYCDNCQFEWIGKSSTCEKCKKTTSNKYDDLTLEEKQANVATYSCRPGTSDHQTGLAVDLIQTSLPSKYDSLIQEFGDTDAGIWLAENCYKFGFVLRFPEDKEEITGIIYEPWHFRYVGREHATKMHELNMCLEEYVEYLDQTGYFK